MGTQRSDTPGWAVLEMDPSWCQRTAHPAGTCTHTARRELSSGDRCWRPPSTRRFLQLNFLLVDRPARFSRASLSSRRRRSDLSGRTRAENVRKANPDQQEPVLREGGRPRAGRRRTKLVHSLERGGEGRDQQPALSLLNLPGACWILEVPARPGSQPHEGGSCSPWNAARGAQGPSLPTAAAAALLSPPCSASPAEPQKGPDAHPSAPGKDKNRVFATG